MTLLQEAIRFLRVHTFDALYAIAFLVSLPWIAWRFVVHKKNRSGWSQKLFGWVPVCDKNPEHKRVWLHAVSVGEVNLLAPMIQELEKSNPDLEFAISTTTETGFELAKSKFAEQIVFFFPSDFSWAIKNSLSRIKPNLILLAELEVWPNLVQIAGARNIPVTIFNGRLSASSARGYGRLRWITRPTFSSLDLVAAQDPTYAQRFADMGCDPSRVHVVGNLKFDGASKGHSQPGNSVSVFELVKSVGQLAGLKENHQILIAGSTQVEDERVAAKAFLFLRESLPELRLVVVPRHPNRVDEVVAQLESLGLKSLLRSKVDLVTADPNRSSGFSSLTNDTVLIIDVIGELRGWWNMADVAFVGGSFGSRGGQNMIEPAALGVPVCFGPNTRNFQTVVEQLLSANAVQVVDNSASLAAFVVKVLEDSTWTEELTQNAESVVLANIGAAARTAELLLPLLDRELTGNTNRSTEILRKPAA